LIKGGVPGAPGTRVNIRPASKAPVAEKQGK
jgi:ribosomal protein L3